MTNKLIEEKVDIYQLPRVDERHKAGEKIEITIGDLHGNAIKLLYVLIKHGFALNMTGEHYAILVAIYCLPVQELTRDHLVQFNAILDTLEFNTQSLLRLLGDELSDRGNNDYFTLKIFEKLGQHGVPFEILVSNHGIEFIEASEIREYFLPRVLADKFTLSMRGLQYLISKGLVSREEILALAKSVYKPALRAISYTLNANFSEITLYSHAGIGLNSIERLARKCNIPFKCESIIDLAITIERINAVFQGYVQADKVHILYTQKQLEEGYATRDVSYAPFVFLLWNRNYNDLLRPIFYKQYMIIFVHGHDSNDPSTEINIVNLNNALGYDARHFSRGLYNALYSYNTSVNNLTIKRFRQTVDHLAAFNTPDKNLKRYTEEFIHQIESSKKQHNLIKLTELLEKTCVFLNKECNSMAFQDYITGLERESSSGMKILGSLMMMISAQALIASLEAGGKKEVVVERERNSLGFFTETVCELESSQADALVIQQGNDLGRLN
ncbi:MAG: Dot/Icm T4SS effector Wip [Tatlockia sp.]|jgi:hypothetical protein